MKSLLYCRDPGKVGQNFIPAKRNHVITPLEKFTKELDFLELYTQADH